MQFNVDDFVVHPIHGVGHIVEIKEKRFSEIGAERLYYKITLPRSTIWIPVEAQATIGLRSVTAKRDLDQYRNLLKSRPVPLHNDHPQRHVELASRLKQGSFQMTCEIVRDLTAWGQRKPLKPLGVTDKAILQKTRECLYQEWGMAAGMSNTEAVKEVDTLLQASHQAYNIG